MEQFEPALIVGQLTVIVSLAILVNVGLWIAYTAILVQIWPL